MIDRCVPDLFTDSIVRSLNKNGILNKSFTRLFYRIEPYFVEVERKLYKYEFDHLSQDTGKVSVIESDRYVCTVCY